MHASKKIVNNYNIIGPYELDMIDIFPQSIDQEKRLSNELKNISKDIKETVHGNIYILNKKIQTDFGFLKNIKIRNYDSNKKKLGAIDLIVKKFDEYKNNVIFGNNINYISNEINDFIEYDDFNIFLYVVRNSNLDT